jgi:hypothetical protein
MSSTESSTTGVMGYDVVSGSPVVGRSGCLTGEFVFTGKRGATYLTYRANGGARSFQFMRLSGVFCALHGNYTLPVAYVAAGAVVFTDADRVA